MAAYAPDETALASWGKVSHSSANLSGRSGVPRIGVDGQGVGMGMVQLREVGLVFAGIRLTFRTGWQSRDLAFHRSAVVAMVIVTAMVAWSLARRTRKTEELLE